MEKVKNISFKKILYIVAAVLTPLAGAVCGIVASFAVGASTLYTQKQYSELFNDASHVHDTSKYVVEFAYSDAQSEFMTTCVWIALLVAAVFFAGLILMSIFSGSFNKDENGRIQLNAFDRIWTEVQLFAGITAAAIAIILAHPIIDLMPCMEEFGFFTPSTPNDYVYGLNNSEVIALCAIGMFIFIEIATVLFVSLIKKLKAGHFIDTALLGKSFRFIKNGAGSVSRQISVPHENDEKANLKLTMYYLVILIGMIMLAKIFPFVGTVVDIVLLAIYVPTKTRQLLEIQKGVVEVKSGNLNYRIPVNEDAHGPKTELDKLAADINTISVATDAAVQNELKSERMKVELISNVSHDLRTPLTSMISYIDILKKEGLDSPDAPEHLQIIEDKTKRLKDLTDNLFEAAKASSGNIPCNLVPLKLSELMTQELAEMDDVLSKNNLQVVFNNTAADTTVMADGKLLARVIENILSNVAKYAMDNSRVYIDISETVADRVLLEVKNISREQLNITPNELMERFTRGDESRNTEGSGLGLAISKDLMQLMGGAFEISIDGDMFKSTVVLPKAGNK